ncbi:MAG: hypothetical protein JNM75_05845 [Rhodospirillales bacterium]|nr:hypothetical protein [Rhodospirillales bacterium]
MIYAEHWVQRSNGRGSYRALGALLCSFEQAEGNMSLSFRKTMSLMMVAGALSLGACASSSSVDNLESEVAAMRNEMAQVKQESATAAKQSREAAAAAEAAAAEARSAAQAANAAAERSDRMFQRSLRK